MLVECNRIKPVDSDSRLRAIASITIEGCFVVHDLRVIDGDEGLFVAMPSKKINEEYVDIAHPINAETRKIIEDVVIEAYKKAIQ